MENKIQELENLNAYDSIIPKLNLLKSNKINPKTLDVKSPLPTGIKYKEIKFDKDDEKQNKQTINPVTAGFIIKTYENEINLLNSQYNDLIIKKMNDDLTIAQKREIHDEIGNVLKNIKMNEDKIYEAKEKLKNFSDTNFDEKLKKKLSLLVIQKLMNHLKKVINLTCLLLFKNNHNLKN